MNDPKRGLEVDQMRYTRGYTVGAIMLFGLWAIVMMSNVSVVGEVPTRDEIVYCTFTGRNFNSYNCPGDTDSFYMRVQNTYEGNLWREDGYDPSSMNLYYAILTIDHMNVMDENLETVQTVISEDYPGSISVDNGPGNRGFNISYYSNLNYYKDHSTNKELSFRVNGLNVKAGTYNLPVVLSFVVRTNYDPETGDGYGYSQRLSVKEYVPFVIRSGINGVSDKPKELFGSEGSTNVPIYSGSRDIMLNYGHVMSQNVQQLENFGYQLEAIPDGVTLPAQVMPLGTLDLTPKKVFWKMDVLASTSPGTYYMYLNFEYEKAGVQIREGPYRVFFSIAPTPLVSPDYGENDLAPMVQTVQGAGSLTIPLSLSNIGNVDIETGKVLLDLDSAIYLSTNAFYFDEGLYSGRVDHPLELNIDELQVGGLYEGAFPAISLDESIPPGDYYIPLDYRIYYRDPTVPAGSAMLLGSFQMDEKGMNDYLDINYFRSSPRDPGIRSPHIILRVVDDSKGSDVRVSAGPVLEAGTKLNELTFKFENMEKYPIRSVSLSIRSKDPMSLYSSSNTSGDSFLLERTGLQVPAADGTGPGTMVIPVLVDVPLGASSSFVMTTVRLTGRDINNKYVNKELTVPVSISVHVPKAYPRVVSVRTSEFRPGGDFTVTMFVMNSGDGNMTDLGLLLMSNSSLVSVKDPSRTSSDINPGEMTEVTFECSAHASMVEGEGCCLYLMTRYTDATGQVHLYSENEPMPIMVSSLQPKEEEERTDSYVYIMIGVMVGSLFISLALLLSVIIIMVLRRPKMPQPEEKVARPALKVQEEVKGDNVALAVTSSVPTAPSPSPAAQYQDQVLPPYEPRGEKPFSAIDDLFK